MTKDLNTAPRYARHCFAGGVALGVAFWLLPATTPAQTAVSCVAPTGVAPAGITVTSNAPNVVVQWAAVAGARRYAVARRNPDGTCWNLPLSSALATSMQEPIPAAPGTYQYQVGVLTFSGSAASQWTPYTVTASNPLLIAPPSTLTPVTVMSDGPPPTGLAARGTPTTATVTWTAVAGATGYLVNRAAAGTTAWTSLTPAQLTTTTLANDVLPDRQQTYTYQVLAYQANGHYGAASVNYTAPKPTDPTGLTAALAGPTSVRLSWQAAPSAGAYLVSGPGVANGTQVTATSFTVPGAPVGNNLYRVASVFTPGGVLTLATSWPAATARVAPIPTAPFFSIANGPGSTGEAWSHNSRSGVCWNQADGWTTDCINVQANPQGLYSLGSIIEFWGQRLKGVPAMKLEDLFPGIVTFADTVDLGFGRRVWCGNRGAGILCIANSHGPAPGVPGFNDSRRVANAAAMNTESRGYTVISQQALDRNNPKMFFYQFGYAGGVDPGASEPDPVKRFIAQLRNSFTVLNGNTVPTSTLDTQGPKFSPHACLACHGGRYNPADGTVIGGSMLPIDPSRVAYSSMAGATRAEQEKKISDINGIIRSAATPMVQQYLNGLYGSGTLVLPARTAFVPAGWTGQQGLWNTVVRPYCISCHMAQPGPLAFTSFADMQVLKDRVQKTVCTDATMPHSELLFRRFWSEGGAVFLPGLLSTALGFSTCP